MKTGQINYEDVSKYKYKLTKDYTFESKKIGKLKINDAPFVGSNYIKILNNKLTVSKTYMWDGASGPAIDTKSIFRGALVHDALYQCIREGHIDLKYRKAIDKIFYSICREDGMPWWRAQYVYRAVRLFGAGSAKNNE